MSSQSAVLEKAVVPSPVSPDLHVHRWRIDEQGAAHSAGRCRCGVERVFENGWEGDRDVHLQSGGRFGRRQRELAAQR